MLEILFPNLNERKNCQIFWGYDSSPDPPTVFETNQTCLPMPCFAKSARFCQSLINADFCISGIGPDVLMNVLKDRTIFHIWAALILFNFLSKNRFSVWTVTENASLISFHGGIWSRYSEINKLKISKDLTFQK